MRIDQLSQPLLRLEIFQGLRPLQITEIARRAERIVYRPGQTITQAGAPGDAAFVLVAGEASRVADPGLGVPDEPVTPGSLVSEMAMLIEQEHGATVVARGPVRALKITRAALHEMMLEDPSIADHFVARITRRLKRVADELRAIDSGLATGHA